MNKKSTELMKSVGISMIAGGATAVIGSMMMSGGNSRKYRKMANKAAKTAGDIMDTITHSFKM
ncbi:MAG: hypothetical protein ACI4RB_02010 [Acutalibacteraceae bacterium]